MYEPQRHRDTEKTGPEQSTDYTDCADKNPRQIHLHKSASSAQSTDNLPPFSLGLCASVVNPPPSPRSLGTAMMETVLVLPLIFVILALLFFFGQAMTRLQRSSVTDRYEAWRQTQYAPGPGAQFAKAPVEFGNANLLDQAFFAGNASNLSVTSRAGRINITETSDLVSNAATDIANPSDYPVYNTGSAGDMVRARLQRSPAWWRIDLATEHTSDVPFYQRFAGPVQHQHTVIDGDWSYGSWIEQKYRGERQILGETLIDDVYFIGDDTQFDGDLYPDLDDLRPKGIVGLSETFYKDFDPTLEQLDEQNDNPIAHSIRLIYLHFGGYRGPQILPELNPIGMWYQPLTNDPDPGDTIN
jgi:hypothetical protein